MTNYLCPFAKLQDKVKIVFRPIFTESLSVLRDSSLSDLGSSSEIHLSPHMTCSYTKLSQLGNWSFTGTSSTPNLPNLMKIFVQHQLLVI